MKRTLKEFAQNMTEAGIYWVGVGAALMIVGFILWYPASPAPKWWALFGMGVVFFVFGWFTRDRERFPGVRIL